MSALRSVRLRHDDAELVASTGVPGHLDWLSECLAPAVTIEPADAGASDCLRVVFDVDAETFDRWQDAGPHGSGELLPAIDRDALRVSWPRWNCDGDDVLACDPEFQVFVRVASGRVVVLSRDARPWSRVAWLRVVRQVLMEQSAAAGAVFVHAAAFEAGGRVALIAGPKRAGKTTLLVHALSAPGVAFVANDRVSLRSGASGLRARGLPTLVNVRPGTRAFHPGRFDGVDDGPDTACFTRRERRDGSSTAVQATASGDVTMLPAHFAEAVGASMSPGGPPGAVLFPLQDPAGRGIRLEPMDDAQAREAWEVAAFGTTGRDTTPTLFGGRCADAGSTGRAGNWLRDRGIPMLRCRLGPDAYAAPAEAFVAALADRMAR